MSSKFRNCQAKLEESELVRERLTNRLDTLCKKCENEDQERDNLEQKVERLTERVRSLLPFQGLKNHLEKSYGVIRYVS